MLRAAFGRCTRTERAASLIRKAGVACSLAWLTTARSLWAQPEPPAQPSQAEQFPQPEPPAQSGPASASDGSSTSDASAELFREGRQLLNKGRFAAACEKFRASLELRRSPGTLLNVGNCLEGEGKLVAAFDVFEEVLVLAAAEPDARKAAVWKAAAEQEKASLEPRIPRLTIRALADAAVQVTLDGQPLQAFGQPLPLDPGRHELRASASGKQPFEQQLELAEGQAQTLEIPALDPVPLDAAPLGPVPGAPVAAPPLGASPASENAAAAGGVSARVGADSGSPRVWPWVLIGAGGAVFAGGAVTGLIAAKMHSDLEEDCPSMGCEDPSRADRGETTALVADVTMLTGLVAAGVGTVWLLTVDDDADTSLTAGCTSGVCGAALRGRF